MPVLTDLIEVKKILDIPIGDKSEDAKLNFFIEWASNWILEILNRPELFYSVRTEYYSGTGTQKILLKARPVYTTPTIQVVIDENGYYGSSSGSFQNPSPALTYGSDFCVVIDQEDGSSRSGILVRINALWPKPSVRQVGWLSPFIGQAFGNVKVTYAAGYTVNNMPSMFRSACNTLVARMRYVFPLAMELGSESYEDRSISVITEKKDYLLSLVKPFIISQRNWKW